MDFLRILSIVWYWSTDVCLVDEPPSVNQGIQPNIETDRKYDTEPRIVLKNHLSLSCYTE